MKSRGFKFSTEVNNYFYNDETGEVSCLNNIENDNSIDPESESVKDFEFLNNEDNLQLNIKEYKYNTSQLILVVTESCNFRCRYCVYSGEYKNNRVHSSNLMDKSIAQLAVYKYISYFKSEILKNNIAAEPVISFFGGEPLLNFQIIKETVKFSKSIYHGDITYSLTTNGSLFNEKNINFFIENNFYLNVTLNGDIKEHDRLRVFSNGNGSYNTIVNGLKLINQVNTEYYKSNVGILTNFDTGTDLIKLTNFLESNKYTRRKRILISKIIDNNTSWYGRYSIKEKEEYNNQLNELKSSFINSIKRKEYPREMEMGLFGSILRNILNRNIMSKNIIREQSTKYGGTCIPGSKIAVSWDGSLHICEKVNLDHPIGNVWDWLDYKEIERIITKYNNVLHQRCSVCNIRNICTICFKDLFGENGKIEIISKTWCDTFVEEYKKSFSLLYSLLEEGIKPEEICKILWGIKP